MEYNELYLYIFSIKITWLRDSLREREKKENEFGAFEKKKKLLLLKYKFVTNVKLYELCVYEFLNFNYFNSDINNCAFFLFFIIKNIKELKYNCKL